MKNLSEAGRVAAPARSLSWGGKSELRRAGCSVTRSRREAGKVPQKQYRPY